MYGSERICRPYVSVVMRVNADLTATEQPDGIARDVCNFPRKRAAVRIAEDDAVGSRILCSQPASASIVTAFLEAVNAVLGVEEHDSPAMLEESNRLTDHRKILFRRAAEHGPNLPDQLL